MAVSHLFGLKTKEVVAIIGCGGKTTLMNHLAHSYPSQRVLLTTSTKIWPPACDSYDHWLTPLSVPLDFQGCRGVSVLGTLTPTSNGLKLAQAPTLQQYLPYFDKVFIEADGSKGKPLKAWSMQEPVILPETSCTIGVLPAISLGLTLNPNNVHRFSKLLAWGGFHPGQLVTPAVLARIISHPQGLFAKAVGRKILLLTHVVNLTTLNQMNEVIAQLPETMKQQLDRIVAVDFLEERGRVLWQNHISVTR
ncbi:MAG: putative selenium-dependent hydroxylase accessory protein YqeC [Lactobacillus sp.]|jgi:probable selenium-dependent hydroxylase accessory protein YqeC|nr:putative selenium-dependent hydroxylase accessory protein YqeC [Lactobacillus sp.]